MLSWQVASEVLITLGNLIFVVNSIGEIRRKSCYHDYLKKSRIKTPSWLFLILIAIKIIYPEGKGVVTGSWVCVCGSFFLRATGRKRLTSASNYWSAEDCESYIFIILLTRSSIFLLWIRDPQELWHTLIV